MLGWQQCGFLWAFVIITFAVPFVRNVAVRLTASMVGALVFVVFILLNSFNHAPSVRGQTVEYYGYPYTYYDNRENTYRPPRNGSHLIPGEHWNSDSKVSVPSILGNLAVYLLCATILAWPISVVEVFMTRSTRKPIPGEEDPRLHERPSWAR